MRIIYHGHSEFSLINSTGFRLLTDPCDPAVGYGNGQAECNAVTVSHGHHDHNWVQKCPRDAIVMDVSDWYMPEQDVIVDMIKSAHDDVMGEKRGLNLLSVIVMDGVHVLHCGDLGHLPDSTLKSMIGQVDVLLVPVGGYYTIDAKQAAELVRMLKPRVVIPMHYKTEVNADWPIATLNEFLDEMNATELERQPMPTVRITKEDLSEHKRICVLEIKPHG